VLAKAATPQVCAARASWARHVGPRPMARPLPVQSRLRKCCAIFPREPSTTQWHARRPAYGTNSRSTGDYKQSASIRRVCPSTEARHYPFRRLESSARRLRTVTRWGATKHVLHDRDSARRLRGSDDRPTSRRSRKNQDRQGRALIGTTIRELVPLSAHATTRRIRGAEGARRPRCDITSIDARSTYA